jgi:hypothetical protein
MKSMSYQSTPRYDLDFRILNGRLKVREAFSADGPG